MRTFILGDRTYEGDEAYTLTLRYFPQLGNTLPDSTIITITDDDLPTYRIIDANNSGPNPDNPDVGAARANEGSNISFAIELVGVDGTLTTARSNVVFQYALDDISATFGADYTNPNGTGNTGSLTIPIGSTRGIITVPALADGVAENTETFRLRIVSQTGVAPAFQNSAIGTIINVGGTPIIGIANARVVEGTATITNLVFTVTLSSASASQVTVDYETLPSVPQSATPNVDYSTRSGRITFPGTTGAATPGSTTQQFSVPIITDRINEPDETFRVRLFNPSGGNVGFSGGVSEIFAVGTILDDDSAGTVSMDRNAITIAENLEGRIVNVPVTFTPTGTPARPVTVDFTTIPGTAVQTGRIDYFGKSGQLTFQPSTAPQTKFIPIEIFDDNIREDAEQFIVRLTAVDGADFPTPIVNSTNPPATDTIVTIADNEPIPQVRVTPVNARVLEGSGTQRFNVFLLNPSQSAITLSYRFVDGDDTAPITPSFATRDADYEAADSTPDDDTNEGTITFTIGGPDLGSDQLQRLGRSGRRTRRVLHARARQGFDQLQLRERSQPRHLDHRG